jgi:PHD/YefM family antitoxin component YafN of YafNO toxin-antitoxin module
MNELNNSLFGSIREVLLPRDVLLMDGDDLFNNEEDTQPVDSYRKGKDSAVVIYSLSKKYLAVELDVSEDKIITELEKVMSGEISFMVITSDSKVCVWVKKFKRRRIVYTTLGSFYRPAFF